MRRIVILASAAATAFCLPSVAMSAPQAALTTEGFMQAWGTSNATYDLNGDGTVNAVDLGMFLSLNANAGGDSASEGSSSGSMSGNSAGGSSSAPLDVPTLRVGTGFTSVTSQPDNVGQPTDDGADAKAIARWDAIPFSEFDDEILVGVVAFHKNGIECVRFSANGGAWEEVREMRLNPQTGVTEYFVKLRAEDCVQGLVELRAIVLPSGAGVPRVLQGTLAQTRPGAANHLAFRDGMHSLWLYAQPTPRATAWVSPDGNDATGDGSATRPFATITRAATRLDAANNGVDGCTILLQPGSYSVQNPTTFAAPQNRVRTTNRYLTIKAAPGAERSSVRITSCGVGGMNTKLLRFEGVTFYEFPGMRTGSGDTFLWLHNCLLTASSRFIDTGGIAAVGWSGVFATDCRAENVRHNFRAATLIRNCHARQIAKTPFGSDATVLNCSVDDYAQYMSDHADVLHWFWNTPEPRENRVLYGLNVTRFRCQAFFAEPMPTGNQRLDNVAIVNVHVSKDNVDASGSWWQLDTNHLLLWNTQLPDQTLRMSTHATRDIGGQLLLSNVSMKNCIFRSLQGAQVPQGPLSVRHIHLLAQTYGSIVPVGHDVTTGWTNGGGTAEAIFINPAELDYRIRPGAIGWARVPSTDALVPTRLGGELCTIGSNAPLGAFAAASE